MHEHLSGRSKQYLGSASRNPHEYVHDTKHHLGHLQLSCFYSRIVTANEKSKFRVTLTHNSHS